MGIAEHDQITQAAGQNLSALVERQRSQFRAEGEVTYATRMDRLKRLKALIIEKKQRSRKPPNANSMGLDPMNSACFQSLPQRSRPLSIQ